MKRRTPPPKPYLPLQTRTRHRQSHRPHPMCKLSRRAPAFINTCHDARFAPHVGANANAGVHPSHNALSTPPITSSRIATQPTTRHIRRGRTGRERHDVEADVDEGGPRAQAATDRAACAAAPHQHQPPPQRQDAVHSAHLYKRPTLPETRTQPATGVDRRTPTTRCHGAGAPPGRRPQTAAREPPAVAGHPQKREQRAAPRHWEGGQRRGAAGGGPRPGAAPAAACPAATTPHATPPANNNRMAGRQMSCPQQPAPPPRDAAKMSPRISIGPEPFLAADAPSVSFPALPPLSAPQPTPPPPTPTAYCQSLPRSCVCVFVAARVYAHAVCHSMLMCVPKCAHLRLIVCVCVCFSRLHVRVCVLVCVCVCDVCVCARARAHMWIFKKGQFGACACA
jgi:hypothetical protein